ncbi:MAG: PPE family protein [Mycobacterium sp.]|nr:PPE family protein [Mycobacterium sp.]
MSTEPWGGYIPEINAGRQEAGAGPSTWLAAGAMWTDFAAMVGEAMAAMSAELASLGINWQGLAPTAMTAAVGPFMMWLATMEANAAANALSCFAVAEAYAVATGSMIPLPAVNMNRISEAIAEATNFLGVNSGIIAALNAEYGEFWGNNGAVMVTYDEAVQTATIPKPASPPPPLASAAAGAEQIGQAMADAAAQQALGQGTDAATNAMGSTVDGATSGTGDANGMSSMLGSASSLFSAPEQALSQFSSAGSGLTQPLNSLTQPFTSLLSTMGGSTSETGALGLGPGSMGSLAGFSSGGIGDGGGGGAGLGGGGVPIGGGLGGAMLGQTYMGASGGPVKSQQVFNGVSARPSIAETVANAGPGPGGAGGGGGLSPMMHGGGSGSTSKSRASNPVYAVPDTPDPDERST